jgi:hypothetical protein
MPRNVKNISNSPMGIFWETKAISYENSVFSLKSIPFEIILKKTIFTKSGKKVTAVKIKKKLYLQAIYRLLQL